MLQFHHTVLFHIVDHHGITTEGQLMSDGDELDLASLPDDELVTQMHEDLYDGMGPEIVEGTMQLLDRG